MNTTTKNLTALTLQTLLSFLIVWAVLGGTMLLSGCASQPRLTQQDLYQLSLKRQDAEIELFKQEYATWSPEKREQWLNTRRAMATPAPSYSARVPTNDFDTTNMMKFILLQDALTAPIRMNGRYIGGSNYYPLW